MHVFICTLPQILPDIFLLNNVHSEIRFYAKYSVLSYSTDVVSTIFFIHDDVIKWKIFRVTGHLCGEFTGPRWIPRTKARDAEL